MELNTILEIMKIIIVTSIFFIWVVRYDNIIQEFKEYKLPNWLRDLTGILKLSFAMMLLSPNSKIIVSGALGMSILMLAAQAIHLKSRSRTSKRVPSLVLLIFSFSIYLNHI